MQFIKPDVATICYGIAMSMGSFLLAGGAAGKRAALPNSRILIHQPSGGFQGQSTDIEIHAREVLALRARVDEIYAKHTGQSVERVHADMERDRFFTGEEAVAYGLVDRVIESRELREPGRGVRSGVVLAPFIRCAVLRNDASSATVTLSRSPETCRSRSLLCHSSPQLRFPPLHNAPAQCLSATVQPTDASVATSPTYL